MSSRRLPAVPGAPRPETGRQRGAGLLAPGSVAFVRLPKVSPQWPMDDRSPVTVAGAAAGLSPAFPFIPLGNLARLCTLIHTRVGRQRAVSAKGERVKRTLSARRRASNADRNVDSTRWPDLEQFAAFGRL